MKPGVEATNRQDLTLPVFDNVLLCTDFSPASVAATEVAVKLCSARAVRLTIMHVSEYGPTPSITDEGLQYILSLVEKEHHNLKMVTDELVQKGIQAEPIFVEGSAASAILEHIARSHVDLAIVGMTAARGMDRLLFGSTAESIFRRALCPVVTAGPKCEASPMDGRGGPVIFATDFDDSSLDALRYAVALAEIIESPVHVVHVLPFTAKNDSDTVTRIIDEALHLLTFKMDGGNAVPHCEVLHGSDVSHAVVEYAKAHNAAFLVLGVRRRSRIAAHLPPHRTFRIMMTASCPVLTVGYDLEPALATAAHCF